RDPYLGQVAADDVLLAPPVRGRHGALAEIGLHGSVLSPPPPASGRSQPVTVVRSFEVGRRRNVSRAGRARAREGMGAGRKMRGPGGVGVGRTWRALAVGAVLVLGCSSQNRGAAHPPAPSSDAAAGQPVWTATSQDLQMSCSSDGRGWMTFVS